MILIQKKLVTPNFIILRKIYKNISKVIGNTFLIKNTNDSISSYISLFDLKIIKIILDDLINYEYFLNLRIKYKPNFIICSEKK